MVWKERGPGWEGLTWTLVGTLFPEAAVGGPGLYLVSQPVRFSWLPDHMLLADTAVEQMITSCGDCFEKDKETKGRKSTPATMVVLAHLGR